MQLNLSVWLTALDNYSRSSFIEGCALMFPLLDKAAKKRYPKFKNKERISAFITDEFENVIALGTGLDIQFNSSGKKIIFDKEGIGEVFYKLRCSVIHEAETPDNINFTRTPGKFVFSCSRATVAEPFTITVPAQFCEILHMSLLGCPEYTSIPATFVGRKIRFGRHEIMPSDCVGNFGVLRKQLIFGVK